MNKNDMMFFSFVTVWVILCAGEPDVLDGVTKYLMTTPSADTCTINVGVDK